MAFHVGQKVVCVHDKKWRNAHIPVPERPVKGKVYTVRGITLGRLVLLEEIILQPHSWEWGYGEGGWLPSRFRPVVERKTNISVFTEMLKPQWLKELAVVTSEHRGEG